MQNAPQRVNQGQRTPFGQRQAHRKRHNRVGRHLRIHAPQQFLDSFARQRGHKNRSAFVPTFFRRPVGNNLFIFGRKLIDLVQHAQSRASSHSKLTENLLDFFIQLIVVRVRNIAHVQNQSSFLDLFQRGAKRGQQAFRKIADKSHGVGNQDAPVRGESKSANCRIERGEHSRGNQYFGPAQRVE